jgi:glycine hydroxymethyltransferase
MADVAHFAGLIAADLHPSPIPHCHFTTTTTHKTLRGPRGGMIMCDAERMKAVNSSVFPGNQGGPLMHVIAGKAVALAEAARPDFKDYAAQIVRNARTLAETVAGRGFKLVSGGTDNHLFVIDFGEAGISGKKAQDTLDRAGITTSKSTVPGEKRSPWLTSGLRVGTPAVTTRGMRESDMKRIGGWIADVLGKPDDSARIAQIRGEVAELAQSFPLPYAPPV